MPAGGAAERVLCAILSLISTAMLKDYTNRDISQEYDALPATPRDQSVARPD